MGGLVWWVLFDSNSKRPTLTPRNTTRGSVCETPSLCRRFCAGRGGCTGGADRGGVGGRGGRVGRGGRGADRRVVCLPERVVTMPTPASSSRARSVSA